MIGPIQVNLAQAEAILSKAEVIIFLVIGIIIFIGIFVVAYNLGYWHGYNKGHNESRFLSGYSKIHHHL